MLVGWFKVTAISASAGMIFGNSTSFYLHRHNADGSWSFTIFDGVSYTTTATTGALGLDSNFHFVVAWFDRTDTGAANIQIDNGTVYTGASTASYPTIATRYFLGNRQSYDLGYTGVADEIGIWSEILSADDLTYLYNAGLGKFYPEF
jgi:hypothetical protein